MRSFVLRAFWCGLLVLGLGVAASLDAQAAQQATSQTATPTVAPAAAPATAQKPLAKPDTAVLPTRAEMLRGAYGPYRANNKLLYYHLDIRVDPEKQTISGKNTIRFKMLADGARIQLDLLETLKIDKILYGQTPLKYERDSGAVFIDFPQTLSAGKIYSIDFYYSGHPQETGRFGGMTFKKDPAGRVWINTAFADQLGDLPLDYYVLPEDLEKAKVQFAQAKGMLEAYQHYFGEYPFAKDGYKLIEAPYAGMEHQSAVTYGNLFKNGYLGRDWTGVGISLRFDFIIIHESGHEWFGNSITAADPADMWIHEGWTTYLEGLYVEYRWGKDDAIKYLNGDKARVKNQRPIISERGVNAEPDQDQYFKGALMLNTLRSVVNDDAKWWALLHGLYQHFKYQNILTEDVVSYFNQQTGMNLTPIFDQYLRHAQIPRLELLFGEEPGLVMYKWRADEEKFAMPVRVGTPEHWQIIHPTTQWQWMKTPLTKDEFQVATELYYVEVNKQ